LHRKLENVFYEVRAPRLSWDDIGGLSGPKAKMREMVCLPLTKAKELRAMGVTFPAGVMLWGPLGLGITMLAEAAAKEAGATFVYVSGQEMLGKADRMAQAFDMAVREAPSVFFISDIDWLCPRAGASYEWAPGNFRGKTPTFADIAFTEKFLALLDGLLEVPEVRLVGSCYRIDVVDQAAIKEKKRFNRKIYVAPPSKEDRLEILAIYAARMLATITWSGASWYPMRMVRPTQARAGDETTRAATAAARTISGVAVLRIGNSFRTSSGGGNLPGRSGRTLPPCRG